MPEYKDVRLSSESDSTLGMFPQEYLDGHFE